MRKTRKYEAINIIDLVVKYGSLEEFIKRWNKFLTNCVKAGDIDRLARTRMQVQMGMTDLADQKMNIPRVNKLFLRVQKSLEDTIMKVAKKKNPSITRLEIDKYLRDSSF